MGPGVRTYGDGRQDAGMWNGHVLEELEFCLAKELVHMPVAAAKGRLCTGCKLDGVMDVSQLTLEMSELIRCFSSVDEVGKVAMELIRARFEEICEALDYSPAHSKFCKMEKNPIHDPLHPIQKLRVIKARSVASRGGTASARDIALSAPSATSSSARDTALTTPSATAASARDTARSTSRATAASARDNSPSAATLGWKSAGRRRHVLRHWTKEEYIQELRRMKAGRMYRRKRFETDVAVTPTAQEAARTAADPVLSSEPPPPLPDPGRKRLYPEQYGFCTKAPRHLVIDTFTIDHGRLLPPGPIVLASVDFMVCSWNGFGGQQRKWLQTKLVTADVCDRHNVSSVFLAAVRGHHHCLEQLLKYNVDVNRKTMANMTPFSATYHVRHCHKGIIKKCSPLGVDGESPLRYVPQLLGGNGFLEPAAMTPYERVKAGLTEPGARRHDSQFHVDTGEPLSWDLSGHVDRAEDLAIRSIPGFRNKAIRMGKRWKKTVKHMATTRRTDAAHRRRPGIRPEDREHHTTRHTESLSWPGLPPEEEKIDWEFNAEAYRREMEDAGTFVKYFPSLGREVYKEERDNAVERSSQRNGLLIKAPGDAFISLVCNCKTVPRGFAGTLVLRHERCIQLLLDRGADVKLSEKPEPAMFCAFKAESYKGVAMLLKQGASHTVRLPKEFGRMSLLHVAASMNSAVSARLLTDLLRSGMKPHYTTGHGILDPEKDGDNREHNFVVGPVPLDDKPLDYVGPGVLNPFDWSDIKMRANKRNALQAGTLAVPAGWTALHLACAHANVPRQNYAVLMVKALLANGADPNALTASGHSPLSLAIHCANQPIVCALLLSRADPNLKLGPGICNAMCVLMTGSSMVRRSRTRALQLAQLLIDFGALVVGSVRITPRLTGSYVDYGIVMREKALHNREKIFPEKTRHDRELEARYQSLRSFFADVGRWQIADADKDQISKSFEAKVEQHKRYRARRKAIEELESAEARRLEKTNMEAQEEEEPHYLAHYTAEDRKMILRQMSYETLKLLGTPGKKVVPEELLPYFLEEVVVWTSSDESDTDASYASSKQSSASSTSRSSSLSQGEAKKVTYRSGGPFSRRPNVSALQSSPEGAAVKWPFANTPTLSTMLSQAAVTSTSQPSTSKAELSRQQSTSKAKLSRQQSTSKAKLSRQQSQAGDVVPSSRGSRVTPATGLVRHPSVVESPSMAPAAAAAAAADANNPDLEQDPELAKLDFADVDDPSPMTGAGKSADDGSQTDGGTDSAAVQKSWERERKRSGGAHHASVSASSSASRPPTTSAPAATPSAKSGKGRGNIAAADREEVRTVHSAQREVGSEGLASSIAESGENEPEPTVGADLVSYFDQQCYHCGRRLGLELTPCFRCHLVKYCSSKCRSENWNAGRHSKECFDSRKLEAYQRGLSKEERSEQRRQILQSATDRRNDQLTRSQSQILQSATDRRNDQLTRSQSSARSASSSRPATAAEAAGETLRKKKSAMAANQARGHAHPDGEDSRSASKAAEELKQRRKDLRDVAKLRELPEESKKSEK